MKSYRLQLALLIFACALISTWQWLFYGFPLTSFCPDCAYTVNRGADDIMRNIAIAPFVYRRLTPALFSMGDGSMYVYLGWHFIGRLLLFSLSAVWVTRWRGNAMTIVPLLAMVLFVMYPTWWNSDYSLTEGVIVLAGWLLITSSGVSKHLYHALLLSLMIIGALNRETTPALLALAYFGYNPKQWRVALFYGVFAFISVLLVRLSIGLRPDSFTIANIFAAQFSTWRLNNFVSYMALYLPIYGLLLFRLRSMPMSYRYFILAQLPYLGAVVVLGYWQEVRLQLPLFLAILPMLTNDKTLN